MTKNFVPGRTHNGKPVRRTQDGYTMLWEPDNSDSHKSGWILEHRFVMAQHLGQPIPRELDVHHLNGIKDDDRVENLQMLDPDTHTAITLAEAGMRRQAAHKRIRQLEAELAALKAQATD